MITDYRPDSDFEPPEPKILFRCDCPDCEGVCDGDKIYDLDGCMYCETCVKQMTGDEALEILGYLPQQYRQAEYGHRRMGND
jgi:hypothetical protein